MENYKLASKLKLRFATEKGVLTTEQLWDLGLKELDSLVVKLEEQADQGKKKSFLEVTTQEDKVSKLRFDIALDILKAKAEEQEAYRTAAETKAHNSKILALIAEKKDEDLRGKSVEELEKFLK